jgi:hypothetical protein
LTKPEHGEIVSAYEVEPDSADVEKLKQELVIIAKLVKDGLNRWPAGVVKYDKATRTGDARQIERKVPFYCDAITVSIDMQEIN